MRFPTNWAGNYTYRAPALLEPATVEELRRLVPTLAEFKAVAARHSFNSIADTSGTQISLAAFKSISLNPDPSGPTVTIGAGVTYGELAGFLHQRGFALPNMASLPHISVAGACATATHGSGLANQCLSASVSAIEVITPAGELIQLSRSGNPDIFPGCVVALGALGIVTSVTVDLVPAFAIAQTVYENLPFQALEDNLLAIFSAGYSVSLFTDWQQHRATQAWVKRRIDPVAPAPVEAEVFFGATRQTASLHPIAGVSAENCTEQMGVPGPWHERLPHFRMEYTPSAGAELQSEYFVPLSHAVDAIRAVEELRDHIGPHLFITELRTVAADDLWLSMAYARDSLAIHFTWKPEPDAVFPLLRLIESQLVAFAARPHWGKLFTMSAAQMQPLYPRLSAFRELALRFDPEHRLSNDFLREALGL